MTRAAAGPLGGVTVLDLCSYLAGPYGCTLLICATDERNHPPRVLRSEKHDASGPKLF
jgi:hypothetical protein